MKYWITEDHTENSKRILLLYILVLCFTHHEVHQYVKVILVLVCIAGILIKEISNHFLFWGLVFGMMIFNLFFRYTISSNHYFLAVFTVIAVFIQTLKTEQGQALRINPYRSLIIITMGLATLQKLLSSYFLSGKLIATYILGGGSFYHLIGYFDPKHIERVDTYYDTLKLVKEQPFSEDIASWAIPVPGEHFMMACLIITMLIVASELVLFLLTLVTKLYYKHWFPWILVAFVWVTFTFRQEYSFFALLLILFLLSNKDVGKVSDLIIKSSIVFLLILDLAFWIY